MSKDQISVPRELLERATKDYTGRPMWDALENDRLASVEELRALLAQPNTCTKDGGQCGLGGFCDTCHNVEPVLPRCTCPSGDGSLRWPCPVHPPADPAWLWGKLMEWCRKRGVSPAGYSDLFELCGMQQGSPECPPEPVAETAAGIWRDGSPAHPWDSEWFLAEMRQGHLVVLKPLPTEWSYDFTTADGTYVMRDSIIRWAQLSDSSYIPPSQAPLVLPSLPPAQLPDFDDGWESYEAEFKRLNPGITEAAPPRKS